MMFKQFIEMGMKDKEAMRLELAVERFSAINEEKKPVAKKVSKKAEVEEEKFNPILFTIEAISVIAMLGMLFYGLYFALPAWMVV